MSTYVRTQWLLLVRRPGMLAPLAVTPLFACVFFAAARTSAPAALTWLSVAACTMTFWAHSMYVASEVVDQDRYAGTLEIFLTAPRGYLRSLVVRILTTSGCGLVAFAEVALIGYLARGFVPSVRLPLLFALAIVVCVAGCGAAALLLGGVVLIVKGARTLQNAITYPFYLLGGLLLPHGSLPAVFRWLSDAFFLSWVVDALRTAVGGGSGGWGALAVGAALVLAQAAAGLLVLRTVLRRLRDGRVSLHG